MNKVLVGLTALIVMVSYKVSAEEEMVCHKVIKKEVVKKKVQTSCKPKVIVKEVIKEVPRVQVIEKPVVHERVVYLVKKAEPKLNRVSMLLGTGPGDLEVVPGEARILRQPTMGLQYQRVLTHDLSVGIIGFVNQTVALSLGLDF